jgi:hypothetical protein
MEIHDGEDLERAEDVDKGDRDRRSHVQHGSAEVARVLGLAPDCDHADRAEEAAEHGHD